MPTDALKQSMSYLVHQNKMLTGLSVAYGTADERQSLTVGNAQEVLLNESGVFVPCVRPLTERTLYDLASLTKLFTCLCVLRLCEDGRLSLGEAVGEVDPRFVHLRGVSVGDVLSFCAHLQSSERIDAQQTQSEALSLVLNIAPASPPPVKLYSDMNALVLGYVVEARAGMSLYEYIQKTILRPAGMRETFCSVPQERLDDCANYNYEHRLLGMRALVRTDAPPGTPHDPKARLLGRAGRALTGHAGLFSTLGDMVRFAQALLRGDILPLVRVREIGLNRTGRPNGDGTFVQYLGYLCFTKHPVQRLSEVPVYMGKGAFGLSGFTGNHLAVDPRRGIFTLFLGNRCHNRITTLVPPPGKSEGDYGLDPDFAGAFPWPEGSRTRAVYSSIHYVYQKDKRLHAPVAAHMKALGWLPQSL